MATVVTTGTLAGLGGLGTAAGLAGALAGAVGLGLAAVAAAVIKQNDDGGYGNGGGGYGGGGHGGGSGGYGKRKRRAARGVKDESDSLKRLMEVIRSQDVTGCGKRLICELSRAEAELLSEEELSILNLVGPSVIPGEGVLPGSALYEYKAAGEFGKTVGNCAAAFPMCPLNGEQLMDQVMSYLP